MYPHLEGTAAAFFIFGSASRRRPPVSGGAPVPRPSFAPSVPRSRSRRRPASATPKWRTIVPQAKAPPARGPAWGGEEGGEEGEGMRGKRNSRSAHPLMVLQLHPLLLQGPPCSLPRRCNDQVHRLTALHRHAAAWQCSRRRQNGGPLGASPPGRAGQHSGRTSRNADGRTCKSAMGPAAVAAAAAAAAALVMISAKADGVHPVGRPGAQAACDEGGDGASTYVGI